MRHLHQHIEAIASYPVQVSNANSFAWASSMTASAALPAALPVQIKTRASHIMKLQPLGIQDCHQHVKAMAG